MNYDHKIAALRLFETISVFALSDENSDENRNTPEKHLDNLINWRFKGEL